MTQVSTSKAAPPTQPRHPHLDDWGVVSSLWPVCGADDLSVIGPVGGQRNHGQMSFFFRVARQLRQSNGVAIAGDSTFARGRGRGRHPTGC